MAESLTHIYIVGQTKSGKTQLARRLAARLGSSPVLVYDPISPRSGVGVGGWPAAHVFNDWGRFKSAFWASRGCFVVIDEAVQVFEDHPQEAREMLTRGRHVIDGAGGHVVCLVSQRHRRMDKTARDQCSRLYCFRVNKKDARDLADDWACPSLESASALPKLHYLTCDTMGEVQSGVLKF